MMGGSGAHEYMAPCAAGENEVALAPGYAANVEVTELRAGDPGPNGGTVEIEPAIEVGNIFKLGTRYSEPLGATYLDEDGGERPIVMGSYGIGPARIVAAAIEQGADERGIVWPPALAPWQVHLVSLAKAGEPEREAADRLYEELRGRGRRGPLRRPRRRGGGEADRRRAARLPAADRRRPPRPRRGRRRGERARHRRRAPPAGRGRRRAGAGDPRGPSMAETAPFGRGRVRRLFGLDRSGPPPPQTRKGEPLNPWTLPNLVGYVRLAAIPLFLCLAFDSGDGRSAAAAARLLADRRRRLPRRLPRPRHRPVQPPRARCSTRSSTG